SRPCRFSGKLLLRQQAIGRHKRRVSTRTTATLPGSARRVWDEAGAVDESREDYLAARALFSELRIAAMASAAASGGCFAGAFKYAYMTLRLALTTMAGPSARAAATASPARPPCAP